MQGLRTRFIKSARMSAPSTSESRFSIRSLNWKNGYGLIVLIMAALAFLTPFLKEEVLGGRVGALLILSAIAPAGSENNSIGSRNKIKPMLA